MVDLPVYMVLVIWWLWWCCCSVTPTTSPSSMFHRCLTAVAWPHRNRDGGGCSSASPSVQSDRREQRLRFVESSPSCATLTNACDGLKGISRCLVNPRPFRSMSQIMGVWSISSFTYISPWVLAGGP